MFSLFKKKKSIAKSSKEQARNTGEDSIFTPRPGEVIVKHFVANQTTELDLLKKQLADQEELIRDLVVAVTHIANHKRFEHIQAVLIKIHNKLDKMVRIG